ncbi:MAG: hypothetical protein WCO54_06360 [Bacteroidota bacterium]
MRLSRVLLMVVLFVSVRLCAQDWNGGEQLTSDERAEKFIQKMNESVPFKKAKKDSVILVFKTFYDELQLYNTAQNKEVIKVLTQKRDNNVKQILANDELYSKYIQYMEDLRLKRQKEMEQYRNNGQQNMRQPGGGGMNNGMRRHGGF